MRLKPVTRATLAALLPAAMLFAGAPATHAAPGDLVMAVCEGTFSGAAPAEIVDKYHPIAEVVGNRWAIDDL